MRCVFTRARTNVLLRSCCDRSVRYGSLLFRYFILFVQWRRGNWRPAHMCVCDARAHSICYELLKNPIAPHIITEKNCTHTAARQSLSIILVWNKPTIRNLLSRRRTKKKKIIGADKQFLFLRFYFKFIYLFILSENNWNSVSFH